MKRVNYGILGSFSKGMAGSLAVNFAPSQGFNCDPACPYFRGNCYAAGHEARRPSLRTNLLRKAADLDSYLAALTNPGTLETLANAPWVRFSAFGSVPAELTREQATRFEVLAAALDPGKTHLPVETPDKYRLYQNLGFRPRLSLAANPDPAELNNSRRLSLSIDDPTDRKPGWTNRNKTRARQFMRDHGNTKICPAITGSAKCGQCKLCSGTSQTTVIYPEHT